MLSNSVMKIKSKISANTYLVGGAVRDHLLGLPVTDNDYLVVGCSVDEMLAADFVQVGKDFPVFLHPTTKDEHALARTEKKQGQGYTGFTCNASPDVTIEEDLMRRDLTINAIAKSSSGELIDPYHGQFDIAQKVLRHVSAAFVEDPLRVFRVARFASRFSNLGFTIADETLLLMKEISDSGELLTLSGERIWKEMQRSLTQEHPQVFFEVLQQCGALSSVWPDLDKLWGIPNPANWHPEICSGIHTMLVLEQAALLSEKTSVRFAALCHDLGKGLTPKAEWPSHRGHEKSGLPLVEKITKQLKVPSDHKKLALLVCEYHLHVHKAFELKASTLLKVLNALDVWRNPDIIEDFLLACQADFLGRLGLDNRAYPQKAFMLAVFEVTQQITAREFVTAGLKGPAIKEAMNAKKIEAIKALIERQKQ